MNPLKFTLSDKRMEKKLFQAKEKKNKKKKNKSCTLHRL